MSDRVAVINGEFVPESQAGYALQERGVLFADGVYEVVRFDRGRAFDMDGHVARLRQSLAGIDLPGVDAERFRGWSRELVERNGLADAKVYWQVTRGPAERDFVVPGSPTPTAVVLAYPKRPISRDTPLAEGSALLVDDCRWTRCRIKSLMLLPASLAKTRAVRAGAAEAVFVRAKPGVADRHVTEGASTNVFLVRDGLLQTHPDDGWVLGGITRAAMLRLAETQGFQVHEQPFTPDELAAADEAFVCSTTQVTAITSLRSEFDPDAGTIAIGDGRPGPSTQQLHTAYLDAILSASPS